MEVKEFYYKPGQNDAEYIKLLKEALERQRMLTLKAISKLKKAVAELNKYKPTPPVKDAYNHYNCPECRAFVYKPWVYCPYCGKGLMWEKK